MSQITDRDESSVERRSDLVVEAPVDSVDEENFHAVQPFRLAKAGAVRTLANHLVEKFGLSSLAAAAIANAVEDPADARRQLAFPGRVRVPGGTLQTVTARVSAYAALPHIVNGRVIGSTAYPASVHNGGVPAKFWAERDLVPQDAAELRLTARSRQQVADALEIASRELLAQNDLSQSIREHGVFFPVTLVAMTVETDDGGERVALSAVEGSSRAASSHRILGIQPSDPLFGTIADPRAARSQIQALMAKLDLPVEEVASADLERARAASIPAIIVVGFEPDSSGSTLIEALDAYVAFLHIDPPKEWTEPAKENKLADYVVDEVLGAGFVKQHEAEWYAGMLSPEDAAAKGLSEWADERSAAILRTVTAPSGSPLGKAVGVGVKRYTLTKRAEKNPKALAAASLALRAFSTARKKDATQALSKAWEYDGFWNHDWEATSRTPEELRDLAIDEVRAGEYRGAASLELAARGSYYLVTGGVLAAPEPGSVVQRSDGQTTRKADKRYANAVLREIVRAERGINLLYEAVKRGRMNLEPARVNENGAVPVTGAGSPVVASKSWLREAFPAPEAESASADDRGPVIPTATPEYLLDQAIDQLEASIEAAATEMRAVEGVRGTDNDMLVGVEGIDSARARVFRRTLGQISEKVTRYEVIWQMKNTDIVDDEASDLDGDAETDGDE